MALYVTRHGQTEWNVQRKVCGLTDVSLTPMGIRQAEDLGKKIVSDAIRLDLIVASPLKRAIHTAQIIENYARTVKKQDFGDDNKPSDIIPMITDKRLIEQNYGVYEGVSGQNLDFQNNKKQFAFRYPQGESMMDVAYRVYGIIEEYKQQAIEKNILFVCHGGVCRVLNTYFRNVTNEEFYHWQVDNAFLMEYSML